MVRKVFIDRQWKWHTALDSIVSYPPDGYKYVIAPSRTDFFIQSIGIHRHLRNTAREVENGFPVVLAKSVLESKLKTVPSFVDLTFAFEHLVFRKEPWVVGLGGPSNLVGGGEKCLRTFNSFLTKSFSSNYCKKIIVFFSRGIEAMMSTMNCSRFMDKIVHVPLAVPAKKFSRRPADGAVRLLFLGSSNIPGEFEIKGGILTLRIFEKLRRSHSNCVLTIRSDIPSWVRSRYSNDSRVNLVEGILSPLELQRLFETSDILLMPCFHTPYMTFLEAMSYGLPIVTTDVYANPEIIENGKTGIIVELPSEFPRIQVNGASLIKRIRRLQGLIVSETLEKISDLITDSHLRDRMGAAAREKIETGDFSIRNRNSLLSKTFDEALTA